MNRTLYAFAALALLLPTAAAEELTVFVPTGGELFDTAATAQRDAAAVVEEHDGPVEPYVERIRVAMYPLFPELVELEEDARAFVDEQDGSWDLLWVDPVVPVLQRAVEDVGSPIWHCGQEPLTQGKTGVSVSPDGHHITVFVGVDKLPFGITIENMESFVQIPPVLEALRSAGVPVEVREAEGAGLDAGICMMGSPSDYSTEA